MAYDFMLGQFKNGDGLPEAVLAAHKPLKAAALFEVARNQQAYRQGGHHARGGQKWAPWSPAYARDRARKGRTNILVDSGILRNSLTSEVSDAAGPEFTVLIGTNVHYAAVHQHGVNKIVYTRPHHRTRTRKRGKWAKDKKTGQQRWRKGAKLKSGLRSQVQAYSYRQRIPQRKVIEVTHQDAMVFAARIEAWANDALNGKYSVTVREVP